VAKSSMPKMPKATTHPGFNKMVHTGGHHPGYKAAAAKAMAPPGPQGDPGTNPMADTLAGPAAGGGMPPGC